MDSMHTKITNKELTNIINNAESILGPGNRTANTRDIMKMQSAKNEHDAVLVNHIFFTINSLVNAVLYLFDLKIFIKSI